MRNKDTDKKRNEIKRYLVTIININIKKIKETKKECQQCEIRGSQNNGLCTRRKWRKTKRNLIKKDNRIHFKACYHLGYNAVQSGRCLPTFLRNSLTSFFIVEE
jgi:hypothetical protein